MKGIQDSLGFWIPRRGFRISGIGSHYFSVQFGFWIPIVSGIPDSLSRIPDSKAQDSKLLPCEQRLHFRDTSWRAKTSLCRQPFNFLSCMRKIRHAIRKQLVREICVSFAGNYLRTTLLLELLFCFSALILPIVIVVLKVKNEIRRQRYAEVMLEINWML